MRYSAKGKQVSQVDDSARTLASQQRHADWKRAALLNTDVNDLRGMIIVIDEMAVRDIVEKANTP